MKGSEGLLKRLKDALGDRVQEVRVSTRLRESPACLVLGEHDMSLVMSIYLMIAFRPNSAVQRPEGLYKEPTLMVSVVVTAVVICFALLVDIPVLQKVFNPTAPTIGQH